MNKRGAEGVRTERPAMQGIPWLPLVATVIVQTIVTLAAYSMPAVAPAVAADLGVDGKLIGLYVSIVYGVGAASAMLTPGFVHRFGGVRVSQVILLLAVTMLATAALGVGIVMLALSALILGLGYGGTTPSSSHILLRRTPLGALNLVMSVRQLGVPLGGVLAGLIVPPLTLALGWRMTLLLEAVPAILLLVLLQTMRRTYDADRQPDRPVFRDGVLKPFGMLGEGGAIRALALICFVYAGFQLCFVAFMAVYLTQAVGFDLVRAGQMLAAFQISGVLTRPVWGVIADRLVPPRFLLVVHGLVMAAMAVAVAWFAPGWPWFAILLVCVLAGATASGFTGLAVAEFARVGGRDRAAEATGLATAMMFSGVMILPAAFSGLVAVGGYGLAYHALAVTAVSAALSLLLAGRGARRIRG